MSAPAQVNTLRSTDFPNGLTDKASLDRLFQILNPFLQQVAGTTAKGTSLKQQIDGQAATFTFLAGPTFSPLTIRIPDGKHPQLVLAWAVNLDTKAIDSTWNPAWTYLGQTGLGNQVQITELVGVQPGVHYTVNVFVFF